MRPTQAQGREPMAGILSLPASHKRHVGQHDGWTFWEILGPPTLGWPRGMATTLLSAVGLGAQRSPLCGHLRGVRG